MRLIVFEINEVPISVLEAYAAFRPGSFLGQKMASREYFETRAHDLDEELLYPAQAWASLNTGKPFSEHQVKWFNDPKDLGDFFWYQAMLSGKDVAVVGSPHSSQAVLMEERDRFKLLIPDFFSEDAFTTPSRYMPLQEFNLRAAMAGRRSSSSGSLLLDAAKSLLTHPRPMDWGLDRHSVVQLATILMRVLGGRGESLRMAQLSLFAAIFSSEIAASPMDLAVLFTNHVASAMHRYLHATPGLATDESPYRTEWKDKYKNEVFDAIDLLDFWISRVVKLSGDDTGVVMTSAIGQKLNSRLTSHLVDNYRNDFRLERPAELLSALGVDIEGLELVGAMLPQYSFRCRDEDLGEAALGRVLMHASDRLDRFGHYTDAGDRFRSDELIPVSGLYLHADRNRDILTLSVMIQTDQTGQVKIGDRRYEPTELGFITFDVDDHHSGEHSRDGIVIHHNVPSALLPSPDVDGYVDYLRVRGFYDAVLDGSPS